MKVDSNKISSDDKTLLLYFLSPSENITYIIYDIGVKLIFLLLFDIYFNKQLCNKVVSNGNLIILNNIERCSRKTYTK